MSAFWLVAQVLIAQPASRVALSPSDACFAGQKSTVEIIDCLSERLRHERKRLGRYLGFVTRGMKDDRETLSKLAKAQATWETFVTQDCDAVYALWRDGSIRNAKHLACSIDAVALRTHDVWERYLTYQDATPPVLPEPLGGMLSAEERNAAIVTSDIPARVSWKRIPATDPLSPASARRQLPKDIVWATAPLTWDILPTSYGADLSPQGPFKLSTMHREASSPISAALKNVSPAIVALSLTRKRSGIAFYESTFTLGPDRSIAHVAAFNDGASIVEFVRVICGDRDRFDVRVVTGPREAESVGECSASAAVSPDDRYVLLEHGIVDRIAWEYRKFPDNFPQFDQVIGWSKDGRRVALNAANGLILVTMER